MVGTAGGSGSGIEVVLVVPSVVVVESVVADRLAPRRRNVCLDKKLTCLYGRSNPFSFYILRLTNKVSFWYTSVEN